MRERALALPFERVSQSVCLTEQALAGPCPLRGIAYTRLEDVAHVRASSVCGELWRRRLGVPDDDLTRVHVPPDVPTVAHAFAVAPGRGCEPAAFGVARLEGDGHNASPWWWHQCCKTQYASVLGDDHLLRCHGSLVTLLEAAAAIGFDIQVRDETGFWTSRDPRQEYRSDRFRQTAIERLLQETTEAAVDANQHLLAALGRTAATDYFDGFVEVGRAGVIPEPSAQALAPAAGLRNRLVHEYHLALTVAMALSAVAVDASQQREFVSEFLARWGSRSPKAR